MKHRVVGFSFSRFLKRAQRLIPESVEPTAQPSIPHAYAELRAVPIAAHTMQIAGDRRSQ